MARIKEVWVGIEDPDPTVDRKGIKYLQDCGVTASPDKPVEPITLEQMQSFNAPMLSRNPVLHYVFAGMELAEERGL